MHLSCEQAQGSNARFAGWNSHLVDLVYLLRNLADQSEVVRHQHLRLRLSFACQLLVLLPNTAAVQQWGSQSRQLIMKCVPSRHSNLQARHRDISAHFAKKQLQQGGMHVSKAAHH